MSSIIKKHKNLLQAITPLYYYVDNEDNKIYDIEEIQNSFHEVIQKLKDNNYHGIKL